MENLTVFRVCDLQKRKEKSEEITKLVRIPEFMVVIRLLKVDLEWDREVRVYVV